MSRPHEKVWKMSMLGDKRIFIPAVNVYRKAGWWDQFTAFTIDKLDMDLHEIDRRDIPSIHEWLKEEYTHAP